MKDSQLTERPGRVVRWLGYLFGHRHALLLTALSSVVLVPPFLATETARDGLAEPFLVVVLLVGVFAAGADRRRFLVTLAVALAAAGARVAWEVGQNSALLYGSLTLSIVFLAIVGATIVGHVFESERRVSRETLCAALAVYLIFGIAWAHAYAILEFAVPGSFNFGLREPLDNARFDRFIGFSFTTLTTLGYGNVSPATPRADALSTFEAIVGQCYLAIVVARLVSLQITQRRP